MPCKRYLATFINNNHIRHCRTAIQLIRWNIIQIGIIIMIKMINLSFLNINGQHMLTTIKIDRNDPHIFLPFTIILVENSRHVVQWVLKWLCPSGPEVYQPNFSFFMLQVIWVFRFEWNDAFDCFILISNAQNIFWCLDLDIYILYAFNYFIGLFIKSIGIFLIWSTHIFIYTHSGPVGHFGWCF